MAAPADTHKLISQLPPDTAESVLTWLSMRGKDLPVHIPVKTIRFARECFQVGLVVCVLAWLGWAVSVDHQHHNTQHEAVASADDAAAATLCPPWPPFMACAAHRHRWQRHAGAGGAAGRVHSEGAGRVGCPWVGPCRCGCHHAASSSDSVQRPPSWPNHPLSTRRRWAAPPRCARSRGSCSLWRGRAPPAFASPTLLRSGAAGRRCCRVGLGGTAARMRLYIWTHLALALHLKGEDWLLVTQQRADVRLMAIRKHHSHHHHPSHSHRSR